ncbi:hypothetical protein WJX72_010168 [[Myrmecia] bisecta]|uniref:Cell cycle checkpoint protein RAD17 n=1 Tax=[Myrmecia] bisecta TaxID=41462 RepID=A0AAW1Q2H7_9CHLO
MASRKRRQVPVIVLSSDDELEQIKPASRQMSLSHYLSQSSQGDKRQPLQLSQPPLKKAAIQLTKTTADSSRVGAGATTSTAGTLGTAKQLSDHQAMAAAATAASRPAAEELWIDKHRPKAEADLIVHKKKVAELRGWLEAQASTTSRHAGTLLATGPTGCGKSTCIRVLAAELGYELTEWQPPVPTLWAEHQYQAASGVRYVSKLHAFEEFVSRSKLSSLSLLRSTAAAQPAAEPASQHSQHSQPALRPAPKKIILVDDLPHAGDAEQRHRLADALGELANTARCPVIICVTEAASRSQGERGAGAAASSSQGLHKELMGVLDAAGAAHISFNPFTTPNISKALTRIAAEEGYSLASADVAGMADSAGGDLHNAVATLQLVCTGKAGRPAAPGNAAKKGKGRGRKTKAAEPESTLQSSGVARDQSLTIFHALGKVLYNKREDPDAATAADATAATKSKKAKTGAPARAASQPAAAVRAEGEQDVLARLRGDACETSSACVSVVSERFRRQPLPCDPEAVLTQSGLDASSASSFLHENMLEFLQDCAIEDAAAECGYLSDAGVLMSSFHSGATDWEDGNTAAASMSDAMAGSVVVRGLLFSNTHPAVRRFLALKAPASFTIQRAVAANLEELKALVWRRSLQSMSCFGGSARMFAAEGLPYVRCITALTNSPFIGAMLPARWSSVKDGHIHQQSAAAAAAQTGAVSEMVDSVEQLGLDDEETIEDW